MDRQRVVSIYEEYFDIIESYFGCVKKYLGTEEDSHIDLGIEIANYPLVSDLVFDSLFGLGEDISDFWMRNAKELYAYIQSMDKLKCLYSGDITPYYLEHFIKKSALYIDIVIVPDPIFNLTRSGLVDYMDKYYYLSKLVQHVFNIWKLHRILKNDTVDILFVMPISLEAVGRSKCEELFQNAERTYVDFFAKATNSSIVPSEQITALLSSVDSIEELILTFKHSTMLPLNLRNPGSLENFFHSFLRGLSSSDDQTLGRHFDNYLRSQFIRVQEHRHFCTMTTAEPIYDYEVPWHFFTLVMGGPGIDGGIASALQTEKFQWISNVPIEALVVFREEEDLRYMRSILRKGITDLKAKSDSDLSIVSRQLQENLQEAFNQQNSEIQSLTDKVKTITKKEIPITTSGYLAGFIPWLNNVISILFAGRNVNQLLNEKNEIENNLEKEYSSFINLLLRTSRKCEE